MNKLNTSIPGGMPLTGDDLRFIDEAIRLALADIAKGIAPGQSAVIIHGCLITAASNGYNVTDGSIFYNDEIWHVQQHYFAAPNPMAVEPEWRFINAPGSLGTKTFFNGETYNVYEKRHAYLSLSGVDNQLFSLPASMVVRLSEIGKSKHTLTPVSNVSEADGRVTVSSVSKNANIISVRAVFTANITNTPVHVTTLPAAYRPADDLVKPIYGYVQGNLPIPQMILLAYIGVDGRILIGPSTPLGGSTVSSVIHLNFTYFNDH